MYKQIMEYDCVLACIANLMDKPIGEIFPKDFRDEIEEAKGVYGDNTDRAFSFAGLNRDEHYWSVYSQNANSNFIHGMLRGRKAILQVLSLNYENKSHMVYWDGEKLLDPSNRQTYRWLSHCKIEIVLLFNGV